MMVLVTKILSSCIQLLRHRPPEDRGDSRVENRGWEGASRNFAHALRQVPVEEY